ncbi:aminotransferase class I/II-fold pyridoxal phosphate-dependent enzyme [Sporolactobacillus spathodeae]|uniref:Aminotransferase n=1 Tax=Sporolactobacillus spathodeae TaxID=1465502 RepID=A0ABS2QBJ3_9BACL|nr:aminotransferase class I/II-fold pyridoxal phosphate-dependent enzyme [Sporolactobacillus spathodeae]MBM7658524.1 aminotransferase [Sporolactobacillus spathodeae]
MREKVNSSVRAISISGIRRFSERVKEYPDAISLTIGQPDFQTPEHVKEAAKTAIDHNHTAYTSTPGTLEVRQAIAAYAAEKYKLHYDPATEVLTTIGASEALDLSFRTLLEAGDEVIIPGPVYPGYPAPIQLAGGVSVYCDTRDSQFKMTVEQIKDKLTDRTKAIVIPSPANPTGAVMREEELRRIAEFLKDKDIFVISDEIYSELTYGVKHVSIATFPGMREKTLVINGLSKSHAMTGWRFGYILSDAPLISELVKIHQYSTACISSITQDAAIEALINGKDDAVPMRQEYERRLDYVIGRLNEMGLDTVRPDGAFYVFPSIAKFGQTSEAFALDLLDKERVALVPGTAFSEYGEGYLRLTYAYSMEELKEGLDRLARYVDSLAARQN